MVTSEPAGRASEPTGWAPKPAERAPKPAGRPSEPAERPWGDGRTNGRTDGISPYSSLFLPYTMIQMGRYDQPNPVMCDLSMVDHYIMREKK